MEDSHFLNTSADILGLSQKALLDKELRPKFHLALNAPAQYDTTVVLRGVASVGDLTFPLNAPQWCGFENAPQKHTQQKVGVRRGACAMYYNLT